MRVRDVCSRWVRVNSVRINKDFDKVLSRCTVVVGGGREGGERDEPGASEEDRFARGTFSRADGKSRGRTTRAWAITQDKLVDILLSALYARVYNVYNI